MPERIDPKRINAAMKAELMGKNKVVAKPELVTDLNIVLSKAQIDSIIHGILSAKDGIGQVAISGDFCCVDASVGSSVAGPFSSVGSAVSYDPGMQAGLNAKISQKLTAEKVKVNVMLPQNMKIT